MFATTVTAWAIELGMRLTLYVDERGLPTFRTLTGYTPDFQPSACTWASDAAVGEIVARNGLRIIGSTISAARLAPLAAEYTGRHAANMSLGDLLAHPFFGKNVRGVDVDLIELAYSEAEEVAA